MLHFAFDNVHENSHAGWHVAQFNFNKLFHFLQKWFSIFIHDCIDCQMHKYEIMKKKNKIEIIPYSNLSTIRNRSFSMNIKGPLNVASEEHQ